MARGALTGAVLVTVVVAERLGSESLLSAQQRGTISRTARVSIARRNLKEAEGKALTRRTEIAYKVVAVGKKATIFKARYVHGNCGRRCGGYKCKGHAHYPGRSVDLPFVVLVPVVTYFTDGLDPGISAFPGT